MFIGMYVCSFAAYLYVNQAARVNLVMINENDDDDDDDEQRM